MALSVLKKEVVCVCMGDFFNSSVLPPADHQAEPQTAAARGREQGAGEAREDHVLHHRSVLAH